MCSHKVSTYVLGCDTVQQLILSSAVPGPGLAVAIALCTRCSGECNIQARRRRLVPFRQAVPPTTALRSLSHAQSRSRSRWTPPPPRACPNMSAPALDPRHVTLYLCVRTPTVTFPRARSDVCFCGQHWSLSALGVMNSAGKVPLSARACLSRHYRTVLTDIRMTNLCTGYTESSFPDSSWSGKVRI